VVKAVFAQAEVVGTDASGKVERTDFHLVQGGIDLEAGDLVVVLELGLYQDPNQLMSRVGD
jgi:hypothetical protein